MTSLEYLVVKTILVRQRRSFLRNHLSQDTQWSGQTNKRTESKTKCKSTHFCALSVLKTILKASNSHNFNIRFPLIHTCCKKIENESYPAKNMWLIKINNKIYQNKSERNWCGGQKRLRSPLEMRWRQFDRDSSAEKWGSYETVQIHLLFFLFLSFFLFLLLTERMSFAMKPLESGRHFASSFVMLHSPEVLTVTQATGTIFDSCMKRSIAYL